MSSAAACARACCTASALSGLGWTNGRGDDKAPWPRNPDLHHVAFDRLRQADRRIKPLGDDVHEAILDLYLDPRVTLRDAWKQSGDHERHRDARHGQPDDR